jgi:hypothetical protein
MSALVLETALIRCTVTGIGAGDDEAGVRRLRFFGQWDKLKADRSKEA